MKKNKKYLIFILLAIAVITMVIVYTSSKYVLDKNTKHVQNSEQFYFESNLLKLEEETVNYNDLTGSEYEINFNIRNFLDELQITNLETKYVISVDVISPENSTITKEIKTCNKENNQEITADPNGYYTLNREKKEVHNITLKLTGLDLTNNPEYKVRITAKSSEPYVKTLSETVVIKKSEIEPYEAKTVDMGDYKKLLIKSNSYSGSLKITYDSSKLILNKNSQLLENVSENTENENKSYIILDSVKENSNYQIEFIKKSADVEILETDITVETYSTTSSN